MPSGLTGTVENLFGFDEPSDLAPRLVELYREHPGPVDFVRTLTPRIAEGFTPGPTAGLFIESYLGLLAARELGRYLEPYDLFRCLSRAAWDCIRTQSYSWRSDAESPESPPDSALLEYPPMVSQVNAPEHGGNPSPVETFLHPEGLCRMLSMAIGDLSANGRKLPGLIRLSHLLPEREPNPTQALLARPVFWEIDQTPPERPFDALLDSRLHYHQMHLGPRRFDQYTLSVDEMIQLRDAVLLSPAEETTDTFLGALEYGVPPGLLAEALQSSVAELSLAVSGAPWRKPVWGLCRVRALVEALESIEVPEQQRLVLLEALALQQLAETCRPFRLQDHSKLSFRPEELQVQPNELEEAIDLGIRQDALSTMRWVLDHSRISVRLVQSLSVRAARVDTGQPDGLGLHFTSAALDAYHTSTLPFRDVHLLALVKFLAEREKIHRFDHALVHALRS